MAGGGPPVVSLPEILVQNVPVRAKNSDFQLIFPRSASAVTPSEKCSIMINNPTMRFPMNLR